MYQTYLGFWKYLQIFVIAKIAVKPEKIEKTVYYVKFLKTFGESIKSYKLEPAIYKAKTVRDGF